MKTRKLNVTCTCMAVYNSSIEVPADLSLKEAIAYANDHKNDIPLGELVYISDSDELDVENCNFDKATDKATDDDPTDAHTYYVIANQNTDQMLVLKDDKTKKETAILFKTEQGANDFVKVMDMPAGAFSIKQQIVFADDKLIWEDEKEEILIRLREG